MDAPPLSEDELIEVYNWVDQIPVSKQKKNITRDFADGVMMAEVIAFYFPKMVELHNYVSSTASSTKFNNWTTLNKKVLKKLNFQVSKNDIEHIVTSTPDIIERVLKIAQNKIRAYMEKGGKHEPRDTQREEDYEMINTQEFKDILIEKDSTIKELKGMVQILELKLHKMQELNRMKDQKIKSLIGKFQEP